MAMRASAANRGSSSRFDYKGTSPEQASAFSDIASDDGRNGGGGFVIGSRTSSFKAQHLANEIASIEQRCDWLEERNKWLTDKLLRSQRSFIERTMAMSGKVLARHVLKAWREAMDLLRLEHQLEQQTASLDKCQQVAKELGAALAREQEVSRKQMDARRQIEADYEELAQAHGELKQFSAKQTGQINSLQRQVQLVMGALDRNKSDAQTLVDGVDELQARVLELKKDEPVVEPAPVPRAAQGGNSFTIEESMKLRDEAQTVMNSMSGLLQQQQSQSGGDSPDRSDRRQQGGKYQPSNRFADGQSRGQVGGSERIPSPMGGRFQTVNQIVNDMETAPSIVSNSEMPWAGASRAAGAPQRSAYDRQPPVVGSGVLGRR